MTTQIFVITQCLSDTPLVIVYNQDIEEVIELLGMWHEQGTLPLNEGIAVREAVLNAKPPNDGLMGTAVSIVHGVCGMTLTIQVEP